MCHWVPTLTPQAEAKKLEDAATYLSLPSTKAELEEKGHSTTGKSMQSLGSCTISKDSFQISTLVCSTKLTQNGEPGSGRPHPQGPACQPQPVCAPAAGAWATCTPRSPHLSVMTLAMSVGGLERGGDIHATLVFWSENKNKDLFLKML